MKSEDIKEIVECVCWTAVLIVLLLVMGCGGGSDQPTAYELRYKAAFLECQRTSRDRDCAAVARYEAEVGR